MTDYVAYVRGTLPNGRSWSTSRHITSNQTQTALLTTWQNAWTSAWNLATTGLSTVYDASTVITEFEIGTLNGSMRKIAKDTADVTLPGTATGAAYAAADSVVVEWMSTVTQKYGHGFQKLPAPAETQADNGVILATPGANIKAAIASVQTAIQADGSTFFVFPRTTTESGQPAFTKTVTSTFRVREQLGTVRKRERKVTKTYF